MSPLFFFVPYSLPYLRKESEKNPLFHPLFFLHILIPFFHDIHTVFLHMQNCPPYVDKVVDNFLFFLFSFPGLLVSILQFLLKIGLFHTISSLFSFLQSGFLSSFFTLYPLSRVENQLFFSTDSPSFIQTLFRHVHKVIHSFHIVINILYLKFYLTQDYDTIFIKFKEKKTHIFYFFFLYLIIIPGYWNTKGDDW